MIALDWVYMPNQASRRLSLEATRSFQEICQEEFGDLLSDDEAQHRGLQMLNFFDILNRPDGDHAKSVAQVDHQGGRANSDRKYS